MTLHSKNLTSKLKSLQNTQQSIQSLTKWILVMKKKIPETITIWQQEITSLDSSSRILTLLYLSNDVVQTAKKKHPEISKHWQDAFLKVVPKVAAKLSPRDFERVKRMFGIWEDRKIYKPQFCRKLKDLLLKGGSSSAGKTSASSSSSSKRASSKTSTETSSTTQDNQLEKNWELFSRVKQQLTNLDKLSYLSRNEEKTEQEHGNVDIERLSVSELKTRVPVFENIVDSYRDEMNKKETLIKILEDETEKLKEQASLLRSLYIPKWEGLLQKSTDHMDRKRKLESFDDADLPAAKRPRHNNNNNTNHTEQQQQPAMTSPILTQPPPDLSDIDDLLGSLANIQ